MSAIIVSRKKLGETFLVKLAAVYYLFVKTKQNKTNKNVSKNWRFHQHLEEKDGGTVVHQSITLRIKYLCGALSTFHPIDNLLKTSTSVSFIYIW